MMKKAELVFIPLPVISHLVSMVEIAKLIVNRDQRLSITILIMELPFNTKISSYTQSLSSTLTPSIRLIHLARQPDIAADSPSKFFRVLVESQIPAVRNAVTELTERSSGQLAGFVIDMFCTCMIEVANQFEVPSYMFFTSGASFLDLMLHVRSLKDDHNQDVTELKDTHTVLTLPSFSNPVPVTVLPPTLFDKDKSVLLLQNARRLCETKGIVVNTFVELETRAVNSLSGGRAPPVYPVGPMLNHNWEENEKVMTWLDNQPLSSVVFLCFGSMGTFRVEQVREIADGLEKSGARFLWSLRKPPPDNEDKIGLPCDYDHFEEVLPNGFLDRTAAIGRVIGWAPQVAVLAHKAIGGFVSHCGWNSTLESLWYGVPVATWPMYAEQQLNAFEMVRELGLAVEISLDYDKDSGDFMKAEEIERGIRCLMEEDSDVRKKVKVMSEMSRKTLMEGGSSYTALGRLINDIFDNMP